MLVQPLRFPVLRRHIPGKSLETKLHEGIGERGPQKFARHPPTTRHRRDMDCTADFVKVVVDDRGENFLFVDQSDCGERSPCTVTSSESASPGDSL